MMICTQPEKLANFGEMAPSCQSSYTGTEWPAMGILTLWELLEWPPSLRTKWKFAVVGAFAIRPQPNFRLTGQ